MYMMYTKALNKHKALNGMERLTRELDLPVIHRQVL